MKRFSSLFLAAILGSVCTVAAFQWFVEGSQSVKLHYANHVPSNQVAFHVNEDGDVVPLDFTATAEKVTAAVVHIKSTQAQTKMPQNQYYDPFKEFFGPDFSPKMEMRPAQSTGSGVIINEKGYIVTNNHVVQDADIVEVTLHDNRSFKAEVIGTDPDTDIALIKVAQEGLPHLAFVDSDKTKVGEWVLAVGNPFNLNSTVTAGIISAKGRSINILSRNAEQNTAIESFIQTDAAINPGNSGGALVDLQGGLIGINTAIASPTGAYAGYGFAVPANIVSKIVEDLLKFGIVQRGWLGVSIQNINSELVKEHDLKVTDGAYVAGFADQSAAKSAGIKEGDVIVKIDNTPIHSSNALTEHIGLRRPGDKINVVVNREGKELSFQVTLKNRAGSVDAVKAETNKGMASLGITLENAEPGVLKKLDLKNGVKIKTIGPGKMAKYTDIREGFIVTKINDVPVKSVKEFEEILKSKKEGEIITLSGTYEDFPREFLYSFRM